MQSVIKPYKGGFIIYKADVKKYATLSHDEVEVVRLQLASRSASDAAECLLRISTDTSYQNIDNNKYFFVSMPTPLKAFWDVTEACNGRCIHCFTDSGAKSKDELTTNQALSVVDQMLHAGIMSIAFSGGEPFIRDDMLKILQYASKKGMSITVTTNGTLLTNDIMNAIVEMQIKSITFSMDAFYQKTFSKIRKGLDLPVLLRNIRYMTTHAPSHGIEVNVRTTVNTINVNEIESIFKFCQDNGVSSYKVNNTNPWGRAKDNTTLILSESAFKDLLLSLNRKKDATYCKLELPIEKYLSKVNSETLGHCTSTVDTINIFANGDVGPCGFCERRLVMGNILKEEIISIMKRSLPFDFNNAVCDQCKINNYTGKKKLTDASSFIS